jgi:hypothetical protein
MPEPDETEIIASDLSPKQSKAIAALLEEPTMKKAAAAAAGVNEATLWRWLQTPAFRKAYAEARRKVVQQGMARIQRYTSEAASVLYEIMNDIHKPPYTRVAAANSIIDNAGKATELDDYHERIAEIERQLDDLKPRE